MSGNSLTTSDRIPDPSWSTPDYVDRTTAYYDQNSTKYAESTIGLDVSSQRDRFMAELRPGARLLDAGCGSGRDSRYFLDQGYSVVSIDGSVGMCFAASEFNNLCVRFLPFHRIQFDNEFDGIWASASLLHIAPEDQGGTYRRLRRALKPGGVLYCNYKLGKGPRFDTQGRLFTDHDELSLRRLIAGVPGLEAFDLWVTPDSTRRNVSWINALSRAI